MTLTATDHFQALIMQGNMSVFREIKNKKKLYIYIYIYFRYLTTRAGAQFNGSRQGPVYGLQKKLTKSAEYILSVFVLFTAANLRYQLN